MKKKYVPGLVVAIIALSFAVFVAANNASDKAGTKAIKGAHTSQSNKSENADNKDNKQNSSTASVGDTEVATDTNSMGGSNQVAADKRGGRGHNKDKGSTVLAVVNSPAGENHTSASATETGSSQGGMGGGTAGTANTGTPGNPTGGSAGGTVGTGTTAGQYNPQPQGTGFIGGRVSLTFDDGYYSIYKNGLPLLKQYNFKSTQYLISQTLMDNANYPAYFNQVQGKEFYSASTGVAGTELAGHTMFHCSLVQAMTTDDAANCKTNLSPSEQAAQNQRELSQSKKDLQAMFPEFNFNDFATPYGAYDDTVISEIKANGYVSQRSTDDGFNVFGQVNPYNIVVKNVENNATNTTTPAMVQAWVDEAIANNEWLVLVYHDVADTAAGEIVSPYGVSKADLNTELGYISSTGVKVVTVGEALAEAGQAGTITTTAGSNATGNSAATTQDNAAPASSDNTASTSTASNSGSSSDSAQSTSAPDQSNPAPTSGNAPATMGSNSASSNNPAVVTEKQPVVALNN